MSSISKYSQDFKVAFSNYSNRVKRPGYTNGFFTWLRHSWFSRWLRPSSTLTPHVAELEELLDGAKDDEQAKNILNCYFLSNKTKFNNHSFSMYLLERLELQYPEEKWEKFYPKNKKIEFYTGHLYRGSLQSYKDAFKNGISSDQSENIEDYTNDTSMSTGVSTSKLSEVAEQYRTATIPTAKSAFYKTNGNKFWIDYRDPYGINVKKTHKKRGNYFTAKIASRKKEVNIVGRIIPEDIVGCWDQFNFFHKNSRYQPNRIVKPISFSQRLKNMFG